MRRLFSFLLILLVLGLFFNNSVNWHYHELSNGLVIEHAHPFSGFPLSGTAPYQEHNHTEFEYFLLETFYYSGVIVVVLFFCFQLFRYISPRREPLFSQNVKTEAQFSLPLLRAPPPGFLRTNR